MTSSIAVVQKWSSSERVPEKIIEDFGLASEGYGESKLVAERLLYTAAELGILNADICRVGQIAGPVHSRKGMWNAKEWLPTILEASAYLGIIPQTLGPLNSINWIPVDVLSGIICELALVSDARERKARTFHTVNPRATSWEMLSPVVQARLVRKAKKSIEIVSFERWAKALRQAVERPSGVAIVPGAKLLDFYESIAGLGEGMQAGGLLFDTAETQQASKTLEALEAVKVEWMELWLMQLGF